MRCVLKHVSFMASLWKGKKGSVKFFSTTELARMDSLKLGFKPESQCRAHFCIVKQQYHWYNDFEVLNISFITLPVIQRLGFISHGLYICCILLHVCSGFFQYCTIMKFKNDTNTCYMIKTSWHELTQYYRWNTSHTVCVGGEIQSHLKLLFYSF